MKVQRALFFAGILIHCIMYTQEQKSMQQKVDMIESYAKLAITGFSNIYDFFTREKQVYDLQTDVLDHPFKKMLYLSTQQIEQLFEDANKYDNPFIQVRAILLLCRMPVPERYFKSFQKGLDALVRYCFDQEGNFIAIGFQGDVRMLFKDYYRKTPASWRQIAKISDWACRNKKAFPLYTKYYAFTCTQHNEELLAMIDAMMQDNLECVQCLLCQNKSEQAYKMYDQYLFFVMMKKMNDENIA